MTATAVRTITAVNVRVTAKLGDNVIADWIGPAAQGADIQAGWERRFGMTVTNTPWPVDAFTGDDR